MAMRISCGRGRRAAATAALLCLTTPIAAVAEVKVRVGGDFSFRRVAVPKPGEARSLVQIDPDAPLYRLTPASKPRRPGDPRPDGAEDSPQLTALPDVLPEAKAAVSDDLSWYWDSVGASRGGNAAMRFQRAIAMTGEANGRISVPRLQTLKRIAEERRAEILMGTLGTRVSPALVLAVMAVESAGRAKAVSHAGAQGLMQLMPATAKRFGVTDSYDTAQNVKGGAAYLDWLLNEFGGDPVMALAGYNAGEGAVAKYNGVPPYKETRAYVPKVLAAWEMARHLCVTPPELVTDGCVFGGAALASR